MGVDRTRIERLTRELLEAIGEDPDRPGLRQTPTRMAELYAEFFGGVGEDAAAPLERTISVTRGPAPDTLPSGAVYCNTQGATDLRLASTLTLPTGAVDIFIGRQESP